MRIADVMTKELPSVSPEESVQEAAVRMAERRVQALPVCESEELVGIVTDWDVTRAVADGAAAVERPVSDYMSTDLVAVTPDALLTDAAQLMADRRIHHLLVHEDDRFAGMVHLDVDWAELGGVETPIATFAAPI
jgi:CBS domain-containing protein